MGVKIGGKQNAISSGIKKKPEWSLSKFGENLFAPDHHFRNVNQKIKSTIETSSGTNLQMVNKLLNERFTQQLFAIRESQIKNK